MSTITIKTGPSLRTAIAVATVALVLSACGGAGIADIPGPGITESNISAAPAFLSRSCDGHDSPQLFCPNVNGG